MCVCVCVCVCVCASLASIYFCIVSTQGDPLNSGHCTIIAK